MVPDAGDDFRQSVGGRSADAQRTAWTSTQNDTYPITVRDGIPVRRVKCACGRRSNSASNSELHLLLHPSQILSQIARGSGCGGLMAVRLSSENEMKRCGVGSTTGMEYWVNVDDNTTVTTAEQAP